MSSVIGLKRPMDGHTPSMERKKTRCHYGAHAGMQEGSGGHSRDPGSVARTSPHRGDAAFAAKLHSLNRDFPHVHIGVTRAFLETHQDLQTTAAALREFVRYESASRQPPAAAAAAAAASGESNVHVHGGGMGGGMEGDSASACGGGVVEGAVAAAAAAAAASSPVAERGRKRRAMMAVEGASSSDPPLEQFDVDAWVRHIINQIKDCPNAESAMMKLSPVIVELANSVQSSTLVSMHPHPDTHEAAEASQPAAASAEAVGRMQNTIRTLRDGVRNLHEKNKSLARRVDEGSETEAALKQELLATMEKLRRAEQNNAMLAYRLQMAEPSSASNLIHRRGPDVC